MTQSLRDLGRLKQATGMEMPQPQCSCVGDRGMEPCGPAYKAELRALLCGLPGDRGYRGTKDVHGLHHRHPNLPRQQSVRAINDMVARYLQSRAPEPNPALPRELPASPAPVTPEGEPLDPWWEPSLPLPERYSGDFDKCRGFLEECHNCRPLPTLPVPV